MLGADMACTLVGTPEWGQAPVLADHNTTCEAKVFLAAHVMQGGTAALHVLSSQYLTHQVSGLSAGWCLVLYTLSQSLWKREAQLPPDVLSVALQPSA